MLGLLTVRDIFLQPFLAPYGISPPIQATIAPEVQNNSLTGICSAVEHVPSARFVTIEAMCAKAQNLTDDQRKRLHALCTKYSAI